MKELFSYRCIVPSTSVKWKGEVEKNYKKKIFDWFITNSNECEKEKGGGGDGSSGGAERWLGVYSCKGRFWLFHFCNMADERNPYPWVIIIFFLTGIFFNKNSSSFALLG